MKKVMLLRHAQAAYGGPDPDRNLSASGKAMSIKLARFVKENPYFSFEEIWCSPYIRARQTAEPFAELMAGSSSIEYLDFLTPGADPRHVFRKIGDSCKSLLIVGHNPHLSILATLLLQGSQPQTLALSLKKAALTVFKQDSYSGSGFTLSAYLPPSALGLNRP